MSWLSPPGYNPVARMLADLNEPLLGPARRLLPSLGGLDLSPLLVLILIQATRIALPLPPYLS
jgi:YggT family protein